MAQSTSIARSEPTSRRTQNHPCDATTMSLPKQLRNRTTHRVSHGKKAIDPERLRERRDVIRTIRQAERGSNPHPSPVPPMVDDQDSIRASERLEYILPIEQTRRAQSVK